MRILAIDPGEDLGWAVGSTGGRLEHAGLARPGDVIPALCQWTWDIILIEFTNLHRVEHKTDVVTMGNNLIKCFGRGCRFGGRFSCRRWVEVTPAEWKGQVDKRIHNRRVLDRLTPSERAIVGTNHNVIDAVGLLLYAWERWGT
jgi:hypothetical protein